MDWSDEHYVRFYTRDTADFVALGFHARSVFMHLMRKVDRAGILDMGRSGVPGLAKLLDIPEEIVSDSLSKLLSNGCVTRGHNPSQLVLPNFVEAQNARSSVRQRKAEERARRRDEARARSTSAESLDSSHTESHPVTTGHSVQYSTVHINVDSSVRPEPVDKLADGSTSPLVLVPPAPPAVRVSEKELEAIYQLYPRKEGRAKGMTKVRALAKAGRLDDLRRAVMNYAAKCKREATEERFIKLFSTFMGCWTDYLEIVEAPKPIFHPSHQPAAPPPVVKLSANEIEESSKIARDLAAKFGDKLRLMS